MKPQKDYRSEARHFFDNNGWTTKQLYLLLQKRSDIPLLAVERQASDWKKVINIVKRSPQYWELKERKRLAKLQKLVQDFTVPSIDAAKYGSVDSLVEGIRTHFCGKPEHQELYLAASNPTNSDPRAELLQTRCEYDKDGQEKLIHFVSEGDLNLFAPAFDLPYCRLDGLGEVPDFEQAQIIVCDIETTGLDPQTDRVLCIGLMTRGKETVYFTDDDEAVLLERFVNHLIGEWDEILLVFHNGYEFDLPFLSERCKLHDLYYPFWQIEEPATFNHIKFKGAPYQVHRWETSSHYNIQLLDTLVMLRLWDAIEKKVSNGYGLKSAPVELGLRTTSRIELPGEEIAEKWQAGERQLVMDYLRDDLVDTLLLAEHLLPSFWGLQQYLPDWPLSRVICSGNGSRWNKILASHYNHWEDSDDRISFQGALRVSRRGFFRDVYVCDIAAMYPSMQLRYGLYPRAKDPDCYLLNMIKVCMEESLEYKHLAAKYRDSDPKKAQSYKILALARKIFRNSGWGSIGSSIGYNCMDAAALIPAYGREILRLMICTVEATGGTTVNVDTDGIMFVSPNPDLTLEALFKVLPSEIEFDPDSSGKQLFKWEKYDWIFIPSLDGNFPESEYLGKRSTYIYSQNGEIKFNGGRYNSRNNAKWKLQLEESILSSYIEGGLSAARSAFERWVDRLNTGEFEISDLIHRWTVPRGNGGKKLLAQGYQVGDRLQLYYGIKDGEPYPIPWKGDITYPIDVERYVTDAKKYVEVIFIALEDSDN